MISASNQRQKSASNQRLIQRDKHILDASKEPLGRLATKAATLLIGKHKVNYTPYLDMGDFVVVTNSSNLVLTGNKMKDKKYYHSSWYLGNLKASSAQEKFNKNPSFLIKNAIKGMLPKNRLQKSRLKRLTILKNDGK